MAVTEGVLTDPRTNFVTALLTLAKDDPTTNPYAKIERERQQAIADAEAEAVAKEARRARSRAMNDARIGRKAPGSRPYQSAGFNTRAEWEAAGSPEPALTPTKRAAIEAHRQRALAKRRANWAKQQKQKRSRR